MTMMISSPKDLGEALCVARKKLRLTQSQLALASGVGVRFVVDLESGKPTVWLGHVLRVIDSLGGQLDLGQLGAAVRLASVMVSNNTGPAHIAAAVGTPLVDLYALTNPQHTPWQVEHRVLFHDVDCRFCYKSDCPQGHHDCLAKIDPQQVADAVCALLASTAQLARPVR